MMRDAAVGILSIFHFLLIITSLAVVPGPASAQEHLYLQQLTDRAERLQLSRDRYWEVLLHYKRTLSGASRSKIADPNFFLDPQGRVDPRRELDTTLQALFIPPAADGDYFACRFPARFDWLRDRLDIDSSRLPDYTCSKLDKALATVEAKSAVLVFPVGHINSPASMFGHTLLRIDGSSRSNLISYAANYAAVTTDSNGFLYAFKGLSGLYKGYYSLMPYYLKVKEYNDLEHRDMWEYRLKFSEREVRKMLLHLWELQDMYSRYYFLDENCSYNLLFLLEAARPELHLTDKTGLIVLPSQTIALAQEYGILEQARYRPSQGTRIRKMASLLDPEARSVAWQIAYAERDPESLRLPGLPDSQKMQVLDLAAEYVQYRYARKELEKEPYSKLYLRILSERSLLGTPAEDLYTPPAPSPPETGHRTSKIGLGGGVRRDHPLAELKIQPKVHALLDPDQGYLPGAQMKFFDTRLWYDFTSNEVQLKSLHVLDILSLAPRDKFFQPLSWKVATGFDTEAMRDGKDSLIFRINTGGGYARTSPWGGIAYVLGELDLNAGDKVRAKVALGPGVSLGELEQVNDWWKLHLSVRCFAYELGDDRYSVKGALGQNFRVTRNNSIDLDVSHELVNGHGITEAGVLWNHYF